jgi:tetratricopeptide (TPR) repeat protein
MLEIDAQKVSLDRGFDAGIFHGRKGDNQELPEFTWIDLPETGPDEVVFDLNAALENDLPTGTVIYEKEVIIGRAVGPEDIMHELREHRYPNRLFPNFNFEMGEACRQMGLIDEAIEQLKVALETGQNPSESAHLLGLCYKEKGFVGEAQKFFEKTEQIEKVSPGKKEEMRKGSVGLPEEPTQATESFESRAVDAISPADLEIQKKIASLGGCLKMQQGYSV